MAIAASELPEMSRKREDVQAFLVPRIQWALSRLAYLIIPSALAYLVLGDVFIAALFQRGEFVADTTLATYAVLAAYALGLPASASSRALTSAFYALRDTKTPASIASGRVILSVAIGATLMFPLDRLAIGGMHLGAVGLALGSAVGAWMEYALLRRRLASHLGPHGPGKGRMPRVVLSGLVAAGVGFGAKVLIGFSSSPGLLADWLGNESAWHNPLAAVGTAGAFGVVYLGMTSLLGVGMPLRRAPSPDR
jgi:putative peptidoglycan lipid II flippase